MGTADGQIAPKARERLDDPRWQLVQRITVSRSLGRSALLSRFLLYICDRQILGRASEITEQQIGVNVFGRPAGYNSSEDNIVRNYARTLRKRIQEYFEHEGTHEDLRVEIPRGAYVPVFSHNTITPPVSNLDKRLMGANPVSKPSEPSLEEREEADRLPVAMDETSGVEPFSSHERPWLVALIRRFRYMAIGLGAIIISVLIGYSLALGPRGPWFRTSSSATQAARVSHSLWSHLFEQQRDTFIVPADGGLVMLQSFTKQPVSLEDYARGNYRSHTEVAQRMAGLMEDMKPEDSSQLTRKVEVLGARRYTSIVDLDLTTHLSRLAEVVPERLMIRYARDLRIDDLRSGNVILLGSSDANPWVELFQQQLNFRFVSSAPPGGSPVIVNQKPLPGERPTYASEANDPLHQTYGVIAYLPNLDGTGHVLIVEGVNMAGTQAAGAFLLSPALMQPVLERALSPNGAIRPFEVLLSTNDVAANASRPQVVSEHIGTL